MNQLIYSVEADTKNNLIIDISGFEGPIDLLLNLARKQKVDLKEISVFELSKQYINYINSQVELKIDIAADYLVMASWLAYLKSKLLLPEDDTDIEEEITAEEMASELSHRMRRLDAMKNASDILFSRPLINRDTYLRGIPEEFDEVTKLIYHSSLYDLIKSYIEKQESFIPQNITIFKLDFISMDAARDLISRIYSKLSSWVNFINVLNNDVDTSNKRSKMASTFSVILNMVNEKKILTKQDTRFGDIYIKKIDED